MDLLRKLEEDAAGGSVGAGAVATFAMPLFSQAIKNNTAQTVSKSVASYSGKKHKKKGLGLKEVFQTHLAEDEAHPSFDHTEVVAKLKALEKKNKVDRNNATTFGLEDENGNIVRVTVQSDQSKDFENALAAFLAAEEDDHEDRTPEVAEVLFKLRDRFNILDIVWPEVEEDQEEGQAVAGQPGAEGQQPGAEGQQPGQEMQPGQGGPEDLGLGGGGEGGGEASEDDVKSLLSQVIDMMKSDADARRQEALARQKEAEARQHEAGVRSSTAKVKQEEENLDMEEYFKDKNESKKESKQLAKLAQWKREVGERQPVDQGIDMGQKEETPESPLADREEEEELGRRHVNMPGRIPVHHLSRFLLKRIK